MTCTVSQFTLSVTESGLLSAEDVRVALGSLPAEKREGDAQELVRELVRKKRLTAFQASAVYQGKTPSLFLGNYVVLEKLGEGGMGMVFKAAHRKLNRIVAIKLLPPAALRSPELVRRFHQEVEAAARLTHPHIVAAFDAGAEGGVHFLVMEFVAGKDLSRLVRDEGPLAVERAVQCVLQTARGLEHAHAAGIIHRDIKPSNLLLDQSGNVKIFDMGLARIGDDDRRHDLTQTGEIMGTVDYMSPEQAVKTKSADARSDIYSLGATLFFLLTGRSVYRCNTVLETLMAHREQPIPSLTSPQGTIPPALEAIFCKMLAKNVGDRYQTVKELIRDIEAYVAGQVVTAGALTSPPQNLETAWTAQPRWDDDTESPASRNLRRQVKRRSLWIGSALAALASSILIGMTAFREQPPTGGSAKPKDAATVSGNTEPRADVTIALSADQQKRERKAANWVLRMGGTLRVQPKTGKLIDASAYEHIPRSDFAILEIKVSTRKPIPESGLSNLTGLSHLTFLDLSYTPVTDDDLAFVRDVPNLTRLALAQAQITDRGLEHLGTLTNLQILNVFNCPSTFTKVGTSHLRKLTRLTRLGFGYSSFDDDDVDQILGLQGLVQLDLLFTQITDDTLEKIQVLTKLEYLDIQRTRITDAGLLKLSALPNLKALTIGGNQITSACFANLRGLNQLQSLSIGSGMECARVVSDGIPDLQALPRLKILGVSYMRPPPTASEMAALKSALPHCQVK